MFDDKTNLTPQLGFPQGENKAPSPGGVNSEKKVEDMFSEIDKADNSVSAPPVKQRVEPNRMPGEQKVSPSSSNAGKYIKIGTVVIIAIIVIGGGWYAFSMFSGGEYAAPIINEGIDENNVNNENVNAEADTLIPEVNEDINNELPAETIKSTTTAVDTDKDGLSDEEEMQLGTNINNVDSDGDYLFDREEVKVYKTDPLNQDTDGDGFLDGAEVKNGYNPKGPGKLFEITQ